MWQRWSVMSPLFLLLFQKFLVILFFGNWNDDNWAFLDFNSAAKTNIEFGSGEWQKTLSFKTSCESDKMSLFDYPKEFIRQI